MNWYEEKQAARQARLEERAHKAQSEATRRFSSAHDRIAGIPMGQPILVGHHSEKRHRRDLERHNNDMRKAIDADKKAAELRGRAASVGKNGISSDDPEAVAKLKEKLAKLEKNRDFMRTANKLLRKGDDQGLLDLGFTPVTLAQFKEPDFAGRKGFADYQFSNGSANIRRIKQRIEQLQAQAEHVPAEPVKGDGFEIIENADINRLQILFDGKPPADVRTTLKRNGFRWAPSEMAWQRQLNNAARYAASQVKASLEA